MSNCFIYILDNSEPDVYRISTTYEELGKYADVEEYLVSIGLSINTISFMVCGKDITTIADFIPDFIPD